MDAQPFKAYVKMVLTRKNTITGVMYSEDPGTPEQLSAASMYFLVLAFLQPCSRETRVTSPGVCSVGCAG